MKRYQNALIATLVTLCAGFAVAQPASGPGNGPGAAVGTGPAASAPGMGMRQGAGRGMGRAGAGITPGWSLMTPQERTEHRDHMRAMKDYDECKTYQAQHHEQMVARAKERGVTPPVMPRRDGCAALKR